MCFYLPLFAWLDESGPEQEGEAGENVFKKGKEETLNGSDLCGSLNVQKHSTVNGAAQYLNHKQQVFIALPICVHYFASWSSHDKKTEINSKLLLLMIQNCSRMRSFLPGEREKKKKRRSALLAELSTPAALTAG